jgi:hypothetical protein
MGQVWVSLVRLRELGVDLPRDLESQNSGGRSSELPWAVPKSS